MIRQFTQREAQQMHAALTKIQAILAETPSFAKAAAAKVGVPLGSPAPNDDLLTARQGQFMQFIRAYRDAHGYSPTVREIGDAMDIKSPNGVMAHIKSLQKKGRIRCTPEIARSIVLTEAS